MPWVVNPTITVNGTPYTNLTFNQVSIDYGRSKIFDAPRAGFARVEIANLTDTVFPFKINDPLVISLKNGSNVDTTVFTGIVTDVRGSFRTSDTASGFGVVTLTAVAPMAQMSRIIVGQTDYPSETDAARIQRILTEAGVTIDTIDAGIYTLAARPTSITDAFTLANQYASSVLGSIYETTDGKVGFANESRRRNDAATNGFLSIPNSLVLISSIASNENIADVMNIAKVNYSSGVATDQDVTSQSTYGVIGANFTTELTSLADAEAIAATYINLRSVPRKSLSSFAIRLLDPTLTTSLLDDLLAVYFGMPIGVPGLPNAIVATDYEGYVEGWNLTFSPAEAVLTLKTSEEAYSYRDMRWQDVDPTVQWEDIEPSVTTSTKTNLVQNPSFEPVDYGKLGYIYLPGTTGYNFSTPDDATLDITGDIDIRVKAALDDWSPTALNALLTKWNSGTAASYAIYVRTGGQIAIIASANGTTAADTTATTQSTVATGLADGSVKWVRGTIDVNNGAGGRTYRYYLSDDGINWTQLGADVVVGGGAFTIANSTAPVTIGQEVTQLPTKGKIYAASIRDGIDGTEVFQFDVGGNWKSTDIDSFTAQTGQIVTLGQPLRALRWVGTGGFGSVTLIDRVTAEKYSGETSLKFQANQTATVAMSASSSTLSTLNGRIPCALGDVIWFQLRAKQGSGSRTVRPRIITYLSSTSATQVESFLGTTVTLDSTWKLIQISATIANATSASFTPYFEFLGTGSIGDYCYIDAIIVEKNSGGYAAYYFDGSSSEIPTDRSPVLAWSGTANDSSSTAVAYWGTKPTTLWNNVDEQGIP